MTNYWAEDRYWLDALDRYVELRRQGQSKLVLDLDILDAEIFSGDSPAYRAMEALTSVWQQEGMEGCKGAPRVVLALSLLLSEMGKRPGNGASCAETAPEEKPTGYRRGLVLAAAWRLLTELFRRHASGHELRLLQAHPGSSRFGQFKLLVNPRVGHVHTTTQLVLNLGGPTGGYEVHIGGAEVSRGDFLMAALSGRLSDVLERVDTAMGLRAPDQLPPSTPSVLAVRSVAELLSSSWLDRQDYGIETAWFDWSGGVRVQPWAAHFGVDVARLQAGLDSGRLGWEEVFMEVSHLFRLGTMKDGDLCNRSLVVNMKTGVVTSFAANQVGKSLALQPAYRKHGGRLEPLVAELLIELRS